MKVIKNNYTEASAKEKIKKIEPYPRMLICEECHSELEYEKSDLRIGALGCVYLDCPCCNRDNLIDGHEDTITLTIDNIEFPIHFFHTSKENGAVDVCNNDEIKKRIKNAVEYFRKNKDEFSYITECGNLSLVVYRYEGDEDYQVMLTNNFYSTYIPFEDEDY